VERKLKPYMGYSREGGSREGAVLIFAYNLKEAKRLCWPYISGIFTDEFTDMAVRYLKDHKYLFNQMPKWSKEKLNVGISHVVDSPPCCKSCEIWGYDLNEQGYCPDCQDEIDADKVEINERL
jgi:hypothetical protein